MAHLIKSWTAVIELLELMLKACDLCVQVDSSTESAEAACDILSQLVNCSLKTLGLISTARPSFMELPKVSGHVFWQSCVLGWRVGLLPDVWLFSFSSVPLHFCSHRGVCQLQISFVSENWRHASGWSFAQGPGGQQQRHTQAVKDEQLSTCFSCRYELLLCRWNMMLFEELWF